jgi:hypothetical protein
MPRRNRSQTWLEVAIQNAGLRKAITATNWAYCWAVTREAIGHDPSVEEVAEWWNQSRRSAFRDQAAFREAFPDLDSPSAIYATPEARRALARHAAAGDKIEGWIKARRDRRELDAMRAVMRTASTGS